MSIGVTIFKAFLKGHVWMYEQTKGRLGSSMGGRVVILTTTGRRTGRRHAVPLMTIRDGERYLVAATAGGDDTHPAWYLNLVAHPKVTLQDHDRLMRMVATPAEGEERVALYQRFVDMDKRFASYLERTDREIPVIKIEPEG